MNEEYLKGLTKEELIEIIYNETTCTYQLQNNWNELKKRVEKQREIGQAQGHYMTVNVCNLFLSEMQELEQGKDENN